MTIDLTRPEHREALRWAAQTLLIKSTSPEAERSAWANSCPILKADTYADLSDIAGTIKEQLAALRVPSQNASIVRALLEGCGMVAIVGPSPSVWCGPGPDPNPERQPETIAVCVGDKTYWVPTEKAPALVLALLACTTKEEAMAALREVGR